MEVFEKTQYQADLAITGTWRGTNTDKIYEELGWESIYNIHFYRWLFYKTQNNLTLEYLKLALPKNFYFLRRNRILSHLLCIIEKYRNSGRQNKI